MGSDNRKLRGGGPGVPRCLMVERSFSRAVCFKARRRRTASQVELDRSRCRSDKESLTYFCRKCQSADISRLVLKQHSIKPHPTISTLDVLSGCCRKPQGTTEVRSQCHAILRHPHRTILEGRLRPQFSINYTVRQILGYYLSRTQSRVTNKNNIHLGKPCLPNASQEEAPYPNKLAS